LFDALLLFSVAFIAGRAVDTFRRTQERGGGARGGQDVTIPADDAIATAYGFLSRGDAQRAALTAERLVAADPFREAAWVLMIESLLVQGAVDPAADAADKALKVLPKSERLLSRLGLCRLRQGAFGLAQEAAERLWAKRPTDPEILTGVGRVFAALDLHEHARAAFERALSGRPTDPTLMFNLATSLRNFGDLDGAEALYDAVIARRSNDWEAYKNRSELRRQTPDANHIDDLMGAVARAGADWRGAVMLLYALGKEHEDLGDYDKAFESYAAGAALRRRNLAYDVEHDLERMEAIKRTLNASWFRTRADGFRSREPIFILGLPRSGSTLLERMLSGHSQIRSVGELQNFGVCVMRQAGVHGGASGDVISASARLDPKALGEAYLASTRPRTGGSRHFIDKLPGNALYAGLIASALPDALLIHIRRDPRDAGLGMFKTLFKQAYPFSYDLDELGRYIGGHHRLMNHWRVTTGERILEVRYEDLVENPEAVVSDLLGRCGLDLEDGCMRFYDSAQPSSTASAVQVRQPVYRTSVGAWRRFERQLQPLTERLEREVVG